MVVDTAGFSLSPGPGVALYTAGFSLSPGAGVVYTVRFSPSVTQWSQHSPLSSDLSAFRGSDIRVGV